MRKDRKGFAALRSFAALTLAICLLVSALPVTAWAASSPSGLTVSSTKSYIKLSKAVLLFTGTRYGEGTIVQPAAGTVCQLYSNDYYTASDGLKYYSVYYLNKRYNCLKTDVEADILTAAGLNTYITEKLWKQSSYETLRESMNLVGDVRVHAVQMALQKLGYYSGKLDGNYGSATAEGVKKFQRANGLGADGSAGPLTQPVLFAMASGSSISSSASTSTGTSPSAGTLRTNVSVNLRKRASTSSSRLSVVPAAVNMSYSATSVQNGITWFQVTYNGNTGWLMGTYVTASGNSSSPSIGKVTITKSSTRVRKSANGDKTGYVLAKGATVDLIAQPTTAGGYTWYNIRTGSGLVGFVRGDCAVLGSGTSSGGSSSGSTGGTTTGGTTSGGTSTVVPAIDGTFVRLPASTTLFTTSAKPSSGGLVVSAGTVLMLYSSETYTEDGVVYCSLYCNNKKYNAVYSDISSGLMSSADVSTYVNGLLNAPLGSSLKRNLNLTGDVRVYALQVALYNLGYYTGKLDGTYGSGTQSAVRNFQRAAKITVDGSCGTSTWNALRTKLNGSTGSGSTGSGSTGSGSTGSGSTGVTVTDFGTFTKVTKGVWNYGDNGGALFPKSTYATVMDIQTGKVFRVYRWSGGSHADCVPASLNDTKTMMNIVGYNFDGTYPNATQLEKIKADGDSSVVNYTWPDVTGEHGVGKDIGSAWDRRPGLINIAGTVYPVSIYGFPHGFNGTDSFSKSKFPNGSYFYSTNCYYGMMCIHFIDSKTHSGTSPDSKHQANIDDAWDYAKKNWPSLCK